MLTLNKELQQLIAQLNTALMDISFLERTNQKVSLKDYANLEERFFRLLVKGDKWDIKNIEFLEKAGFLVYKNKDDFIVEHFNKKITFSKPNNVPIKIWDQKLEVL